MARTSTAGWTRRRSSSDALTYSWTINGHAAAATGVQPTLTWSELQALGVTPGAINSVLVTVDDGQGHIVTSPQTLPTVNKAALTVTADANTKTYGDDDPALTYQVTSGALVNGDSFTGSLTRAAGKDAGGYLIEQGTLALNSNYTLTFVGASLTITPRDLHVSATGVNKTYDGTTIASVTLSDDRVSGDQLTVRYTAAAFADPNAGMGKAVSVSGITISGPAAGNYHLVSATAGPTADITQATPTFSQVRPPVLVDGAATATLSGAIRAGSLVPPGDATITINGVSRNATINADGSFSVAFPTAVLGTGAYTIDYFYAGSTNFEDAEALATLDVTYGILVLSDQKAAKKAGSTIPIQIELLNAAGQDVSSAAVTVKAVGIVPLSDPDHITPAEDAGNSNPGNLFLFQEGANPFYQYNLKTPKGLSAGTYLLFFEVEGDPFQHSVQFTIK